MVEATGDALMFGTKEIKQAAVHADHTLSKVDRVLDQVQVTATHAKGIAEDLHAITARLRAMIVRD